MEFYKILLIVLIVFVLYFTFYTISGKSSNQLTSVTKTDQVYVVPTADINNINQNMSVSNYAISIWIYIDKWDLTIPSKNIINIPNILDLTLGNSTNNLEVRVAYRGTGIIQDQDTGDDSGQDVDGEDSGQVGATCPGSMVDGSQTCCDVLISGETNTLYNMSQVVANTVYQNSNNRYEYTFVYDGSSNWNSVQVYFIRPSLIANGIDQADYPPGIDASTPITDLMIETGTPYDGFQLEHGGALPRYQDLFLTGSNQQTNCNWQTMFFKIPNLTCSDPLMSSPPTYKIISAQTNICMNLKSITISITDKDGKPYFYPAETTDSKYIPYFTFRYFSSSTVMTNQSSPTKLVTNVFPPNQNISGFTNNNDIHMLYTPSSLFNIYNDNILTNSKNNHRKEGFDIAPLYFTGVVNNIPLQTWVNITVNVMNRSLDIYMNGKLEQTYIVPGVPNQMDGTAITVAKPTTFTGWTSNLQYYPKNLNPQSIWNIYQQGYTSRSSMLSLLSKYSIKLIFVDNSTKNQVTI